MNTSNLKTVINEFTKLLIDMNLSLTSYDMLFSDTKEESHLSIKVELERPSTQQYVLELKHKKDKNYFYLSIEKNNLTIIDTLAPLEEFKIKWALAYSLLSFDFTYNREETSIELNQAKNTVLLYLINNINYENSFKINLNVVSVDLITLVQNLGFDTGVSDKVMTVNIPTAEVVISTNNGTCTTKLLLDELE